MDIDRPNAGLSKTTFYLRSVGSKYTTWLPNGFDCIWFPWAELNQRKYGPNMCHGEDRCETGLYGIDFEYTYKWWRGNLYTFHYSAAVQP